MGIKKGKKENGVSIDIPIEPTIGLLKSMVHVGRQRGEYKGESKITDQVLIQFELQDVTTSEGQPVTFGKVMTNSLHEKAGMVKLATALGIDVDNEGIDLQAHAGKPVMLDIQKTSTGKPKIAGFSKLRQVDLKTVKPLNGTPLFLDEVEEISETQKKELPEWIQKLINARVKDDDGEFEDGDGNTVDL